MKKNLLLPPWVNLLIGMGLKPVVYFLLVLALPIYVMLYPHDPLAELENDIQLVRKG